MSQSENILEVTVASSVQLGSSSQDQSEETASQDSNSDIPPRTPPPKSGPLGPSVSSASPGIGPGTPITTNPADASGNISARSLVGGPAASSVISGPGYVRAAVESSSASVPPSPVNLSSSVKEDDGAGFPGRRPSPAFTDIGLSRGIGRGSVVGVPSSQPSNVPLSLISGNGIPSNGTLGPGPAVSDMAKRNILGADERLQPMVSPLSNRMLLQQVSKVSDGAGSTDSNNIGESSVIGGRVFSPSVSGVQWRPQSASSFQNQNEMGQFRPRTEIIAPDQREKFLQRLQQVQQQGHNTLLGAPHLAGGNPKPFPAQQQSSLLQQFNSQSSSMSPQVGLGFGVQSPGSLSAITSSSLGQQNPMLQQTLITGSKDAADVGHVKAEDQQSPNSSDDLNMEPSANVGLSKTLANEEDLKAQYAEDSPAGSSNTTTEVSLGPKDSDLSPGQPLQSNQASANLGVIGRRSVSDLGAIGDNLIVNLGGMHDNMYNLQMLEGAFYKLPQPKDSERAKNYIPRHPTVTPASYPQVPAPIVDTPSFWERLGSDGYSTDTLFFAFYYQQNTYQQYLAARELKKQSWRYHRKYNTWFQRHEEPKVTTDECEKGTYVYFDFHIANDDMQHGWCQRIKTEFTFEYSYLEDELVV